MWESQSKHQFHEQHAPIIFDPQNYVVIFDPLKDIADRRALVEGTSLREGGTRQRVLY
jgi:hypothetical protein